MARIIDRGPVALGTVGDPDTITSWAKYTVDFNAKLSEAASAVDAYKTQLHAVSGWTGSIETEVPLIGHHATTPAALAIGTWAGLHFIDWGLTVEADIPEATGGTDEWQEFCVLKYGWNVEAKKWQASDSLDVFKSLLATQSTSTHTAVAFTSPYGGGNVLLERDSIEAGTAPAQESLTCQGTGALTSADPYIALLIGQVAESLSSGYATPLELSTQRGRGTCYLKSVKYQVPSHEKITATLELQGVGVWPIAGS